MKHSGWVLAGLLIAGCSGSGDDTGIIPGEPGALQIGSYLSPTNQATFQVTGTKTAGTGVEVDGVSKVEASASTSFALSLTLVEGSNRFEARAVLGDKKGPISTIEVTLDTVAPTLQDRSPADSATDVPLNAQIVATFSEALDCSGVLQTTMIVSANGNVAGALACSGSALTFTPTDPLPPTTVVTVTVLAELVDLAGNTLAAPATWSFTTGTVIDETPPVDPTITSPSPVPAMTPNASLSIAGTKEAGANVEARWTVDGTMQHDFTQLVAIDAQTTWMDDVPLNDGVNVYVFRSRDGAGNVSCEAAACTTSFTITKEMNQQQVATPTVQFITPTNAPMQVLFGTKAADTGIAVDGTLVVPVGPSTSWDAQVTLTPGTNNLVVRARDQFGNSSNAVNANIDYNELPVIPPNADIKIDFELGDAWDMIGDEYRFTNTKREVASYAPIIWLEGPIAVDGTSGPERCYFDGSTMQRKYTRYVATMNFSIYGNDDGSFPVDQTGHWWEPNYFVPNFFAALVEAGVWNNGAQPLPPDADRRDPSGNSYFWDLDGGACPPTWFRQPNNRCKPKMSENTPVDAVTEASLHPRYNQQAVALHGNRQPLGSWTSGLISYPRRAGDDPEGRRPQVKPGRTWSFTHHDGRPMRQGAYLLTVLFALDRGAANEQGPGSLGQPPYQWLDALRTDQETCWDDTAHDLIGSHRAEGILTLGTTDVTVFWNEKGPTNEIVDACHSPRPGIQCGGDACDFDGDGNFENDPSCTPPNSSIGSNVVYTIPQNGWSAPVRVRYCANGPCP